MKYSLRAFGIALVIIVAAGSLVAAHMMTGNSSQAVTPATSSVMPTASMGSGSYGMAGYGMTGQGMMMTGGMMGYGMMGRHMMNYGMMSRHMNGMSTPANGWGYCWNAPRTDPSN